MKMTPLPLRSSVHTATFVCAYRYVRLCIPLRSSVHRDSVNRLLKPVRIS